MNELAKQLFSSVKEIAQAIAPVVNDIVNDVKGEASRMGTQGTMELASALFGEKAFVPYGPGQYTPSHQEGKDHQHESGGMER